MSQEKIGRYIIERTLGRGGMGTVYLAFDPRLEVRRAIKVMNTGEVDESYERFIMEARAAVKLNHPNIVSIYDLDEDRKRPYIVMEYVEGEDLKVLIERHDFLPFDQKLDIVVKICNGLHFAHERGVLHRDIKPGNIRITPAGEVKILDFGLARLESSDLTRTGRPMGTAYYMSTEQAKGRGDIDRRSDLYSVGVVLYEFLTYRKPFDYEEEISWPAILLTNLNDPHVPLLQALPGCAEELGVVIDRALAKDREARYRSCSELAEALRGFQKLLPSKQRDLVQNVEALETEFKRYRADHHKLLEWFGPALFENELSENPQQTQVFPAVGAGWKADYGYLLQRQQWLQFRKEDIAQKINEVLPMVSLLEHARQRMEKGDLDGCMQAVEKVLQRFPSHAGTLNLRTECESRREMRQQEDARRQRAQRALEDARLAFEQSKFPQCLQAVSRVLQIEPENAEALDLKNLALEWMERRRKVQELVAEARAYCKSGNWEACGVAADKGLEIEPQHLELMQFREKAGQALQTRRKVDELLRTARTLSQGHDYLGSLATIDEALKLGPGDAEALKLQQAVIEAMQRQHEFDELLSTARGYHNAGDYESCLQTAEQALELDPAHAELQELKQHSQLSLERRNRLLDLSSEARRRMEKRDFGRAFEAIEELLRLDPKHSQALEWQQQARKELEHAEKLEALLAEARLCGQEGDYAACYRIATEGLKLDASHAELKRLQQKSEEVLQRPGRVNSLLEKGQEELAHKDYSRVLRTVADLLHLEPENRKGLELQRVALDALDRFRKAEDLVAKARSQKKIGDDVGCYELAARAIELAPDFPGLLELFQQAERNVEENRRIKQLLEKARAELERRDFQSVLNIVEELFSVSRGNPEGLQLRQIATEGLHRRARFEKLLSQARKYRQEGVYEDCFRISGEALEMEPGDEELRQIHQWAGAAIQKQRQVEELLETVLKQLQQGELETVIEGCGKILELEPAHPQAVELQRQATEAQQRRLQLQESLSAGNKAFHSRDYESAYRVALQGLDLSPDHEELLKLRDEAYQALEKPRKVKALMATVSRQIQNLDYEGAQQTVQVVLGIEPENDQALELKLQIAQLRQRQGQLKELLAEALAYEKAGNDSSCLQAAAKALQLDPSNGQLRRLHEAARARLDKRRRVQELLDNARQLKQQKHFSVVLSTAEELLALEPELAEALALKAEAVAFLARQREVDELLSRARGCSRAGDVEGCYQAATAGLKLEPDHEELQQLSSSAAAVLENKRRRKMLLDAALQHRERHEHDAELKLLEELSSLDPQDTEVRALKQQATAYLEQQREIQALLKKANEYKQVGEYEASLRAAEQGLKLDSQDRELRALLAAVQEAIENASKIASWLDQARKSFEEQRFREALESLQQVLMLQPDHTEAAELQRQAFDSLDRKQRVAHALAAARGSQKAKDYLTCLKEADQGLELDAGHSELKQLKSWASQGLERVEKEKQLLRTARQSLESQNATEALRFLKELLILSPGHAEGLALQRQVMEAFDQGRKVEELLAAARSYRRAGDYEACAQTCQEALELQPAHKEFQELQRASNEALGLQQRITGLLEQARSERQRQDNRAALETLKSLLQLDSTHREGLQLFQQAQEAYQREQKVQTFLAQARQYFQAGDYAACQKAVAGGLEVHRDHVELRQLQERARQASERESRVRALHEQAKTLLDNRDFQGALQAAQQLLSLQPEHAEAKQLHRRAFDLLERQTRVEELLAAVRGHLQSRDYETSRKLALDALKLDPEHAELGRLLENAEKGLAQQERVNQLLRQARQHLETRDPVGVFKILEELLSLSPGNPMVLELQRSAAAMRDQRRKFEELLATARGFRKRGEAEACYRACTEALTLEPENAELKELKQESFQVMEERRAQEGHRAQVKQLEALAQKEVQGLRFRAALRAVRRLLELEPAHAEALALKHRAEKGLVASRKKISRRIAYAATLLVAMGLGGYYYLYPDGREPADGAMLAGISALSIPQSETWPESYPRYRDEGSDSNEEMARLAAIRSQSNFRQALGLAEKQNIEGDLLGGLRHARQLGSNAEQKLEARDFGGARAGFDTASAEINRLIRTVADKKAEQETAERTKRDEQRVREVLDRYRMALLGRDLAMVKKLWPGMPSGDENRLKEYFTASKITVSVEVTSLNVYEGQRAQVICRQQIATDTRGSSKATLDFRLEKRGESWQIVRKLE